MKAEHRKELQTNSLADFLGRTVRTFRGGTSISWPKVLIVVAVIAGVFVFFWWRKQQANREAELWMTLDASTQRDLASLFTDNKGTNPGKAAGLILAYNYLNAGITMVGGNTMQQAQGFEALKYSQELYKEMIKECEGNAEWVAEAKYGLAVAAEALAAQDIKNLDEAKTLYQEVAGGDLGKTGYGKLAARRLEQLNNTTEAEAIKQFYEKFKGSTKVQGH
jgi:hypothetical protein